MSALDSKRFTALGQEWTARFDFNAAVELEEIDGRSFMEIVSPFLVRLDERDRHDPAKAFAAAKAIRFKEIRMILAEALRGAHPDITINDVGRICAAIGVGGATEIVAWAIVQALPTPEDADEDAKETGGATGDENPPTKPNRKARRTAAANG